MKKIVYFIGVVVSFSLFAMADGQAQISVETKIVEEWLTGYSYALPADWLDPAKMKPSGPFNTDFRLARMVSGHISRLDRMRTFFRKDLEEAYQYFLKNNLNKGKVTAKRDITIDGRPARIVDVEYDYPMQINKGRLILIECEEFTYQFFFSAPSSYKSTPDREIGSGYWEKHIEPAMTGIEKSFKSMRTGTLPGLAPHPGRVLCLSNHADLKFELPAGWMGSTKKVVNGWVNLGVSSGESFGGDGISLRFDSYSRRTGSDYADLDTASKMWEKGIADKPGQRGKLIGKHDYVLNGIKARVLDVSHQIGKNNNYRRWVILAETPRNVVIFNLSGYEKDRGRERSFAKAGQPAALHLMRTLSSTRKNLFGTAKTSGLNRDATSITP